MGLLGLLLLVVLTGGATAAFVYRWRTCVVCGDAIGFQDYYVDPAFNDAYHASHTQVPCCDYCGRILTEYSSAGPGILHDNGFRVCPPCNASAVVSWDKARALEAETRAGMAKLGMKFPHAPVVVSLVDEVTLKRLFEVNSDLTESFVDGLTVGERHSPHAALDIYILSGLPLARFRWVIAHELTHAWLVEHDAPLHTPRLEEGGSELAAYRLLRDRKDETVARQVRFNLDNPDPIYGRGLRLAAQYEHDHGFPAFLKLLSTHKDFPKGQRELPAPDGGTHKPPGNKQRGKHTNTRRSPK